MKLKPSIPAYIQVKNDITEKIRKGIWTENQKIPSEQQLMKTYNVGRGTIRDAMKLIIDEGYVYIKKGIGTFVSQNEVGLSLEPFVSLTYFIQMRGLTLESKILDQEIKVIDRETALKTGLKEGSKSLYVRRLRILEKTPLAIEEFYFSDIGRDTFEGYDFTKAISEFMFEEKKIAVSKMKMDFEILSIEEEVKQILELSNDKKMIQSTRSVFVEPNDELFYFLTFYCGENITHLGIDKFI